MKDLFLLWGAVLALTLFSGLLVPDPAYAATCGTEGTCQSAIMCDGLPVGRACRVNGVNIGTCEKVNSSSTANPVCCGCDPFKPLPSCDLDFEGVCPDSASICGGEFVGGDSCLVATPPFCAMSGVSAYSVTPSAPLVVTLSDAAFSLDVYFVHEPGAAGEMRFLDADAGGTVVDTITTNGDCTAGPPPVQSLVFSEAVTRIEVDTFVGSVWIDDLHINPDPGANPVCPSDCSDNGACVSDGVCICTPGWVGAACDTPADCSALNDCSGNGVCIANNVCDCLAPTVGPACEDPSVPAHSQWTLLVVAFALLAAGSLALFRRVGA